MSRIWVVGNGPSLNETPLDELQGEHAIATNKIHLIYPRTGWRPTHYLKQDYDYYSRVGWKEQVQIHRMMGCVMYLWDRMEKGFPIDHPQHDYMPSGVGGGPRTVFLEKCPRHWAYHGDNYKAAQSWHLPDVCIAFNSIYPMLQLAVLMGYDEIYLIGTDIGYGEGEDYFDPEYDNDPRDKSERETTDTMHAHGVSYRSSPVPIYNATVGGDLDVYPRVDIREVLKEGPDLPEGVPLWDPEIQDVRFL